MTRELKSGEFFIKEISGRKVTGIFSVFGNMDGHDDVIWPGSFTKTFQERGTRVYHLWQHDMSSPAIAVVKSLREVTREELPEVVLQRAPNALGGAEVVREYLSDSPRAEEVLAGLKAGVPYEMSFAFDPLKYDFQEKPDARYEWERIRNIREIRLWETSDVLWGANDATAASKTLRIPLKTLVEQLGAYLEEYKAGRRNSAEDQTRINSIATLAMELGADNVSASPAPASDTDTPAKSEQEGSRAADEALTPQRSRKYYEQRQRLAERALALAGQVVG